MNETGYNRGKASGEPIMAYGKPLRFPANRHFAIYDIGQGNATPFVLAVCAGARKPSKRCIQEDLQELGLDANPDKIRHLLCSSQSCGRSTRYGYLWNPCHMQGITRVANIPENPLELHPVQDLTHVSSDSKALRDLRSFFAPRRIFTARSTWDRLYGASVEIWDKPSSAGNDCTQEVYALGNMDMYAKRYMFVEVILRDLLSVARPSSDNVFVGLNPFTDDWTDVRNYCNELHL